MPPAPELLRALLSWLLCTWEEPSPHLILHDLHLEVIYPQSLFQMAPEAGLPASGNSVSLLPFGLSRSSQQGVDRERLASILLQPLGSIITATAPHGAHGTLL